MNLGKFWLVLSATMQDIKAEYDNFLLGESRNRLCKWDYMGYCEFEHEKPINSMKRMTVRQKDYIFHYCNSIKSDEGKILVIYCHRDYASAIEEEIRRYIYENFEIKAPAYDLRSLENLDKRVFWCIDELDDWCNNYLGDWVAFFGMNKVTPFKKHIAKDFEDFKAHFDLEWDIEEYEAERGRYYKKLSTKQA